MINKLIDKRYSPRTFSRKTVNDEILHELFRAASYAASARNEQPWRFVYALKENTAEYAKLFGLLNEFATIQAEAALRGIGFRPVEREL